MERCGKILRYICRLHPLDFRKFFTCLFCATGYLTEIIDGKKFSFFRICLCKENILYVDLQSCLNADLFFEIFFQVLFVCGSPAGESS